MKDLTVIIRIHNPKVLGLLKECLFSLQGCSSSDRIKVLFVCQNFEGKEADLERFLEQYSLEYTVVIEPDSGDLRSLMLKKGFESLDTKYATVLDYDDVTSVHGYEHALKELEGTSQLAAVFGRVDEYGAVYEDEVRRVTGKLRSYYAKDFSRYVLANQFCIHACVMNVENIPDLVSYVHSSMVDQEDYYFFYQVILECQVSVLPREVLMGNYYKYANEGLNTNRTEEVHRYSDQEIRKLKARTLVAFATKFKVKLNQWEIDASQLPELIKTSVWKRLNAKQRLMQVLRYCCYKIRRRLMKMTK